MGLTMPKIVDQNQNWLCFSISYIVKLIKLGSLTKLPAAIDDSKFLLSVTVSKSGQCT